MIIQLFILSSAVQIYVLHICHFQYTYLFSVLFYCLSQIQYYCYQWTLEDLKGQTKSFNHTAQRFKHFSEDAILKLKFVLQRTAVTFVFKNKKKYWKLLGKSLFTRTD